jgi:phytoene synthase
MHDRDLVRLYWPVELRPAFDALFGLEDGFADVVATSTQPALGAIRLAWWRDALTRLDQYPPPPEPHLQAAATELLPRGISGSRLATLEDGWTTLFEERPDEGRIADHGAVLFAIAADLIGASDPLTADAGRIYALAHVARHGLHPGTSVSLAGLAGHRFPRKLRPLTALARLAARDIRSTTGFEPEATPGRAAALLSHRLFGIVA